MNEKTIIEALDLILVERYEVSDTALDEIERCQSFSAAGLMTNDDGLVIRMADGSEFQITVRQSR